MKSTRFFACAAALTISAAPLTAQGENVGSIDFPTSATGEAQEHFLRGVAILHSFGWEQAIEQFQAAQELDPDFALAYWGESLSYNHPLFSGMDPTEPRKVVLFAATLAMPPVAPACRSSPLNWMSLPTRINRPVAPVLPPNPPRLKTTEPGLLSITEP